MTLDPGDPRVLICGSRRWPWPGTVQTVLDRLAARHGARLVVIEGSARGADRAAHMWCERHDLPEDRHRCHPVDWGTERQARPQQWRLAGPERNTRMLLQDRPRLVICFHDHFDPATGGTSDMALRGLLREVPAWLVPGQDPAVGRWLSLELFPRHRARRACRELDAFAQAHLRCSGLAFGSTPAECGPRLKRQYCASPSAGLPSPAAPATGSTSVRPPWDS